MTKRRLCIGGCGRQLDTEVKVSYCSRCSGWISYHTKHIATWDRYVARVELQGSRIENLEASVSERYNSRRKLKKGAA